MRQISSLVLLVLLLLASPVSAMQPVEDTPTAPTSSELVSSAAALAPFECAYDTEINDLLSQTSDTAWIDWVEKLSGAEAVTVNNEPVTLNNRHSYFLFNGASKAYDYLLEQLLTLYADSPEFIEEDDYTTSFDGATRTWKNLILTIPGTVNPRPIVIMSAHFDSTNGLARNVPIPGSTAPGAEDNATGSAALLEAARLLKDHPLPNTVKLIWFTGEEQGLLGSRAYVNDHKLGSILGVVNVDMYGYDKDNDGCFELHVGRLAQSNRVGQCFVDSITAYEIDLPNYDYLTTSATSGSDHSSFWNKGIGAIEVLENYASDLEGSCTTADRNPDYHKVGDTVDKLNLQTGFDITRVALATVFALAKQTVHAVYFPVISR